jgi:hypothetical protein
MSDKYINCMMPVKRTIWNRLGFGECHARAPDEIPGYCESALTVGTLCVLDWKDHIRAFVSGKIMVNVAVKTDVIVTKSQGFSTMSVLPPDFPVRRGA